MLTCPKCLEVKDTDGFYKNRSRKSGYAAHCKLCANSYQTKEHSRKTSKANYLKDKGKSFAKSALYRARKIEATPLWLTAKMREEMDNIYRLAKELSCPVHVDHIIPLKGDNVCGLHVPWNLQLLSPKANLTKSNKVTN